MQDSFARKKRLVLILLSLTHLVISGLALRDLIVPKELQLLLRVILEHTSLIKEPVRKLNALSAILACIVAGLDYQYRLKLASKDTIALRRVHQLLKLNAEQGTSALLERGDRLSVHQDFIRTRLDSIVARYAQQGIIARVVFKRHARKERIVQFEIRKWNKLNKIILLD